MESRQNDKKQQKWQMETKIFLCEVNFLKINDLKFAYGSTGIYGIDSLKLFMSILF